MADNSQPNPKGGKKAATRAFRPTHSTAKLLAAFEEAERRDGSDAIEFLVELGLAVCIAKDQYKYRLPAADSRVNVN